MAQYSALSESYEKEPDKWDGNSLGKFSENLGIVDGLWKRSHSTVWYQHLISLLVELIRELKLLPDTVSRGFNRMVWVRDEWIFQEANQRWTALFRVALILPLCLKESTIHMKMCFSRQVHFMQIKLSSSERCCARTSLDIGVRGSKNLTESKNRSFSLSRNKKINRKLSSGKSWGILML